jgi:DNA-binding MltR family transcriptional regulator
MIYSQNAEVFLSNYAYAVPSSSNATAPSVEPMNITKIPKNQTGNQTATAQNYNSTDTMISSFRSANTLLMQAVNDIKTGNIHKALNELNNARVQIEQQQLAALGVISNPVLQSAREHLLTAKHYIETGNTDGAISELFILRQLKILHQQGMMMMRLPMTRDMNSSFYSAETHLLAAGEALNAYDPQRAISELDIASEQLYSHQLAMLDVISSLFSNTRTHFQQSINDIKANDTKEALSELNKVINSIDQQVQGVLMIKGLPSTAVITTNRVNVTTS